MNVNAHLKTGKLNKEQIKAENKDSSSKSKETLVVNWILKFWLRKIAQNGWNF